MKSLTLKCFLNKVYLGVDYILSMKKDEYNFVIN